MADYYFKRGDDVYGPVDFAGLQSQFQAGNVGVSDMLSHEPAGPWQPFLAMLPAFAKPAAVAALDDMSAPAQPLRSETRSNSYSAPLWTIASLCAAILLALIVRGASTPAVEKWEYSVQSPKDATFDSDMNALGMQGWELVSARRASDRGNNVFGYEVILKRRKK